MTRKDGNPIKNRLKELFGRSIIGEMSREASHGVVIHAQAKKPTGGDTVLFTIMFGSNIPDKLYEEAAHGAEKSSHAQMSTLRIASQEEMPAGCYHSGICVGVAGFPDRNTNQIFAATFAAATALIIEEEQKHKEEEERKRKEKEAKSAAKPA